VTQPVQTAPLREEHDRTLEQLSARKSIFHFAHAAVSLFVAAIMGGASIKLSRDVEFEWAPSLVLPALIVTGVAFSYGVVRLVIGRAAMSKEHAAFERLKTLRRSLELDQVPALPTKS